MDPPPRPEQGRPEPGQILIVIHDFSARSSDELSLSKGDRVELIERDDDFGDGWYLGRHLMNGASGLFPEVYTRIAPRGPPSYPPVATSGPVVRQDPLGLPTTKQTPSVSPPEAVTIPETSRTPVTDAPVSPILENDKTPVASRHVSMSESVDISTPVSSTSPSLVSEESGNRPQSQASPASIPLQPKSLTTTKSHVHGQDSPVMNETLSVIDEHITDMNTPHHSMLPAERRGANDSGSEYSSHIGQRLSYINGEDTDDEEDSMLTGEVVSAWNPEQAAEYLFNVGVEEKHCDVFKEQEITGDVLLGMDQTSVFLKEFELGSVGRRLKTWQKIKLLQDEVNGILPTRRNTSNYGSEVGSDEVGRHRSRSINSSSVLPRIPSVLDRPASRQNTRLSQQTPRGQQPHSPNPISPHTIAESPRPAVGDKRPSASSVREMHHSRQNSTTLDTSGSIMGTVAEDSPIKAPDTGHKKQPSFDKGWTMVSGAAAVPARSHSSSGLHPIASSSTDDIPQINAPSTVDSLDRGYFSGGEADGRQRNVLRKRGSTTHSRNSSYTDEQRIRSATAHSRHSRFGSVDSFRDTPPSAAQKYYGLSVNGRRRTPSESSINAPPRPLPPVKDPASPTVTKLGDSAYGSISSPSKLRGSDWLLPSQALSSRADGTRATSDAVTPSEKARIAAASDSTQSPQKDSPTPSPSRTGSSTPSGGPSLDLDFPEKGAIVNPTKTVTTRTPARKKTKKDTSAYTQGLEKKTPKEQMADADYSGWMKKKSTKLMATWKPRLFILKGRRLSYYYSEDDTQEQGLIDISFHRVLPADNDRLTGLHATLTGATTSPTTPTGAHTTTIAAKEAAAETESSLSKGTGDSMFIFKLVPPRPGQSRAVNFTKPTVHYFAVPNVIQGRLWMAALMKATIDRDDSQPVTTTYQQTTISLRKAREMQHRPPALMNLDEHVDEEALATPASDKHGLNIQGIIFENGEDSGVSGVSKAVLEPPHSANNLNGGGSTNGVLGFPEPRSA